MIDVLSATPADLCAAGLAQGVSHADYHAAPGVSKSGLDQFARSPAHFKAYLSGARIETDALRLGRLTHWAILEPQDCKLVQAPDVDRRTKAGKAEWLEFLESLEGACAEAVTADELAQIKAMRAAVYAHPKARALLERPGACEGSAWWIDRKSGELCRCRPDKFTDDGFLLDLKTTCDASPESFSRSCLKYRYHVQAAFYSDGIHAATGRVPFGFVFVAVEKTPPYGVGVYTLDPEAVELGRTLYRAELSALAQCRERQAWPAYSERIERINLPAWAYREENDL